MRNRSAREMYFFTWNQPELIQKNRSGEEDGQSIVEYAIILVFVTIFIVAMMTSLSPMVRNLFERPVSEDSQADRDNAISSAVYD